MKRPALLLPLGLLGTLTVGCASLPSRQDDSLQQEVQDLRARVVELLADALPRLDYVLLMSVNPGFSGQKFLPHALDKARRLGAMIRQSGAAVEIAMDGGIDRGNIGRVVAAGVEVCVVGSAIFGAADPVAMMAELREQARPETRPESK